MSVDLAAPPTRTGLPKAPTGIRGLDELTGGGLPRGRPTLVVGAAGSGKTLLGLEFLVHGAVDLGEPGVLLSFEESAADLEANMASLGYDLAQLQADGLLVIDAFHLDPGEIVESGAYDLDGLFIRLAWAVEFVGATRVVLDGIEVLFAALGDGAIVRAELARLFRWLKDHGLTAVVTGERGTDTLTRHGVEEYVSDCVIVLDHRVHEQVSTRRLRVMKYRGSLHGTNEYPFLITDRGLVVLPVTSLELAYPAPTERISTGVARLDFMLNGGVFRGSTILATGEPGTGKTTLCAKAVEVACARGERALFVSFEESPAQLVRNMASVGIELQRWIDTGLLQLCSVRPASFGLEAHLAHLIRLVDDFDPAVVALDAIASLGHAGEHSIVTETITKEIDHLKRRGITAWISTLTHGGAETSSADVSSLMDVWLLLRNVESNGERNRLLFVRKCRGSPHSNQVREFVLGPDGIELVDVSIGPLGVLTGSARLAQEASVHAADRQTAVDLERRRLDLALRATETEARIEALRRELRDGEAEIERLAREVELRAGERAAGERAMVRARWADERAPVTNREEGDGEPD